MPFEPESLIPLSPAILHILAALAGEDLHGYGIMQEVARQSGGKYKIGPGTLYDNLKKLLDHGMIEERDPGKSNEDSRRRYYRLTGSGRRLLQAELKRLDSVVRQVRLRLAESR